MRLEVNGLHLWFDVDGPGLLPDGREMVPRPTLLLLHGGPGGFDHSCFKPDFSRLAEVAQVVYLDLPGHGRSDWGPPDQWTFEKAADDLHSFCQALEIANPIVLGHSFGGPVAIAYGARHPKQPAGIVLQSTFARFDLERVVEGFRELAGDEVADIVRRSYAGSGPVTNAEWARVWDLFGPWVPGEIERARISRNQGLNEAGGALMLRFDFRFLLGEIRCPTLVSVGELDPITPVWAAEETVGGVRPEFAQLDVIEGAGHFPWRDQPDRYFSAIESFIRTTTAG